MKFILSLLFFCLSVPAWADLLPVVVSQKVIQANFNQPTDITLNAKGEILVLDGAENRILKLSSSGLLLQEIKKEASEDEDDDEASLLFSKPMGMVSAGENILVADTGYHRIAILNQKGLTIGSISNWGHNQNEKITYSEPIALAYRDDIIYWSDRANHRVCRNRLSSGELLGCFGERGEGEGQFQFPFQIAIDRDDYLHVVDVLNARVQVFDKKGRFFSQVSRFGVNEGELFRPNGIAFDDQNILYVSDAYYGTISLFKNGRFIDKLRQADGSLVQFKTPTSLHWHKQQLYIVDAADSRVIILNLGQREADKSQKKSAHRAEMSQKNCVTCHLSWVPDAPKPPLDKQGVLPVASFHMCYSCHHGAVLDSRLQILHNGQHPTLYDAEEDKVSLEDRLNRKEKLPEEFPLTQDKQMTCTSCHTPHNSDNDQESLYNHENAWMRTSNRGGDLCEQCHETKVEGARERDPKKRGINHPLSIRLDAPPSDNDQGYATEEELHEGLPDHLQRAGGGLGYRAQLICQSCHQVHGGETNDMLIVTPDKGDICANCHPRQYSKDEKDARKKGIHPVNVELEEPIDREGEEIKEVTCDSCHKVHDGSIGTALLPNKAKVSEDICIDCHERHHADDKEDALKKGVHPMNVKLDDPVTIAGKKIKTMTCLSCHSIHEGEKNTPALLEDHHDGQLCRHCHDDKQAMVGTDHDLRITAKKKQNHFEELPKKSGVCGTCHTMHKGKGKLPHLFAAEIVKATPLKPGDQAEKIDHSDFKEDQLCLNCHQKDGIAEEKAIKHFSHPYKDMVLRSDKDVMPLLMDNDEVQKVSEFGQIACITCHEAHMWEPKDPKQKVLDKIKKKAGKKRAESVKLSTNKDNLEGNAHNSYLRTKGIKDTFCMDCHSLETLPKYKYFHDEKTVRDIGVDYLK